MSTIVSVDDFSKWQSLQERGAIPNLNYPGIYIIALANTDISGQAFSWCKEIIYVGMTNSVGGLKSRLLALHRTLQLKGSGHGGGERIRFKHKYEKVESQLFVSVTFRQCDVQSNKPEDLTIMGEVARLEYLCFAEYVKTWNMLPEFNDKKLSAKKIKKPTILPISQ